MACLTFFPLDELTRLDGLESHNPFIARRIVL